MTNMPKKDESLLHYLRTQPQKTCKRDPQQQST